jgi:hypothetical protein
MRQGDRAFALAAQERDCQDCRSQTPAASLIYPHAPLGET